MTITDAQAAALLATRGKTITIDGEAVAVVNVRRMEGRVFAICTTSRSTERRHITVQTDEGARRITAGLK